MDLDALEDFNLSEVLSESIHKISDSVNTSPAEEYVMVCGWKADSIVFQMKADIELG